MHLVHTTNIVGKFLLYSSYWTDQAQKTMENMLGLLKNTKFKRNVASLLFDIYIWMY